MRTTLQRLALHTLLLPAVALAQASSRSPARPRVVAVKSSSLAPYASFLAGFTSEARADVTELTLEERPTEAARVFKSLAAQKPALVLALGPLAVEAQERVGGVLEGAEGKVDGLLMVADKTVGNASVVQALIAFSASRKVPLVALTASQVKEGATLALAPAPLALGQQAGRLANRIVHEKVDPGALAVARPEGLDLSFNLTAAKKSGPSCDVALEVLRFAARRDFAVKVYE
ncbi:hypothetical protein EJ065_5726 [Corallococcus coralloides]|uniref:ABC transporter substrate-binding protein n=1 Tax=Corallococcus coralloides TaxID=184914 RepID=A0A410RZK7_CORCK|nr:ABC transporter substrate binding protein [Corallococcus coralloides]QAT87258.1 hypothetical protein EJ065_5726 [Corallococcus coralloides]